MVLLLYCNHLNPKVISRKISSIIRYIYLHKSYNIYIFITEYDIIKYRFVDLLTLCRIWQQRWIIHNVVYYYIFWCKFLIILVSECCTTILIYFFYTLYVNKCFNLIFPLVVGLSSLYTDFFLIIVAIIGFCRAIVSWIALWRLFWHFLRLWSVARFTKTCKLLSQQLHSLTIEQYGL